MEFINTPKLPAKRLPSGLQLDLFAVAKAYVDADSLTQTHLYNTLLDNRDVSFAELAAKSPIGKSAQQHSPAKRKIRWYQQTLKAMGLLERCGRGEWRLSAEGRNKLHVAKPKTVMLAYATDLGIAIWGSCADIFTGSLGNEQISLCLTSPPYPLRSPRQYGNPDVSQYVDFIIRAIEPITKHLKPGGSIVLNVSNDIFVSHSPARNTYLERLVIAIEDRLGLSLMDRLIWQNPNKLPGPIQWASKTRQQLNVGYEPIYWFTNDPLKCSSDNRRVLRPHTDRHAKLIALGGEQRTARTGDRAYSIKPGSFSNQTAGAIPRNVLTISSTCPSQKAYKSRARELDLPVHGAPYPLALARFLVDFMTETGDLVVDPFAGSLTTAVAAEQAGRRWIASELVYEYVRGAACRFRGAQGFKLNHGLLH